MFCVSPDAETMRETIEGAFVETEEAPNTDDADKTKKRGRAKVKRTARQPSDRQEETRTAYIL